MLSIALDLARRGFYVLPLVTRDKRPIYAGGANAGTRDPEQIALWWKRNPDANLGIDCGHSDLIVMDCDHGLTCYEDFITWRDRNGLPPTYAVHSGRKPEYGVQMYFRGAVTTQGRKTWTLDGCTGDFKSKGGLVVHPPSIHPDSGEAYEILCDLPIADCPDFILALPTADGKDKSAGQITGDGLIEGNRNDEMVSFIGKIRKQISNLGEPECLVICLQRNDRYAKGPMPEDEVTEIVSKQYRLYPNVGPDPVVTIGTKTEEKKITDWREHYHTFEEMENAPPVSFLIEGFLEADAITALAAPVGQRKSLSAANVVHALITREPLFDHFAVTQQPERILYLCPEMGIRSFTDRLRRLGLMEYVGKTLFCRTMSAEGTLELDELTGEELTGAVVIIDTAVRYLKGDENSSEHMRVFAGSIFRLMRDGAVAVLLLHHSAKGTKESNELTLENAMRGSGELGAFVASCWATRLQNPEEPYQSASFFVNVKQRDFESKPFEVTSGPDCRLHIVDQPGDHVKLNSKAAGAPANVDGMEEMALQVIRDNPDLPVRGIVLKLKEMGIRRSKTWVGDKRYDLLNAGVKTGEVCPPPYSKH